MRRRLKELVMDMGFYYWIQIMFNMGLAVCLGTLMVEACRPRHTRYTVIGAIMAIIGVGCTLLILKTYPWIALGWQRQMISVACMLGGAFVGWWVVRRRRNEEGGEFPS